MELVSHGAFPTFVICAAILVLKMMAVGHYVGIVRIRRGALLNPEDVGAFGSQEQPRTEEDPVVARGLRAHRNDLESTLPFLAIGVPYLLTDPSAGLACGLFALFTACRLLFSYCYLRGLQPWRSLLFLVGELCVVAMLFQMVRWGLAA